MKYKTMIIDESPTEQLIRSLRQENDELRKTVQNHREWAAQIQDRLIHIENAKVIQFKNAYGSNAIRGMHNAIRIWARDSRTIVGKILGTFV